MILLADPAMACLGDCNGDAHVGVDELVVAVNIGLGSTGLDACEAVDNNRDGDVTVDELVLSISKALNGCGGGPPTQRLFSPENNQLKRYDLATGAAEVFVPSARGTLNGQICLVPGQHGNFVAGDDTGQPEVRPGWGIYSPDGTFLQKLTVPMRPDERKVPDPIGCAFDADGRLFTSAIVGSPGFNGQLSLFFPPSYTESCILDATVGTPGSLAVDESGNVYVPGLGGVLRFRPPFPNSAAECETVKGTREDFIMGDGLLIAALGMARAANGNWYISNVFGGSTVHEYDAEGDFVRTLFEPDAWGNPAGLAVDEQGTLYYADLGLEGNPPGPRSGKGTVRKVTFDATGQPSSPELIAFGLTFPDSLGILPVQPVEWPQLGGSLRRTYFNREERQITPSTVDRLIVKWRYYTGAIITAAPIVTTVDLPDEGPTLVVLVSSWDANLYALRAANGRRIWSFTMKPQPGSSYPQASTPTVAWLGDRQVIYVGGGMTMYCIDALTGEEIWEFDAGTGCTTCGFNPENPSARERNEILSSPAVFDGRVYFGLDVDDSGLDKGGFFAVRADDGRLDWYFDVATGGPPCRPLPADNIRRFDGYHSAEQLGLPEDFFATRPGCNFPRAGNTCGNVWSSAAIDTRRRLVITASSNCDTDDCSRPTVQCDATGDDPRTPEGPAPMKPFEEAVFALSLDGDPVWRWRPREVDNHDLSFGAVPNLVELDIGGEVREVVAIGGKDGTFYLLDRDGVNEISGVAWDADDRRALPYWETNVVPGGGIGGIIASAAVGDGKIFFTTAVGLSLSDPQKPAAWALNGSDGTLLWDEPDVEPSYAPTTAVPGLVFTGELGPSVRARIHSAATGAVIGSVDAQAAPGGLSSAPTVVNGTIYTGGGNGTRGGRPGIEMVTSRFDTPVSAFCVEGDPDCEPACPEDTNACTFEFRQNGTCASEPAPDTLDCCMNGGRVCTVDQRGTCQSGVCILPTP